MRPKREPIHIWVTPDYKISYTYLCKSVGQHGIYWCILMLINLMLINKKNAIPFREAQHFPTRQIQVC